MKLIISCLCKLLITTLVVAYAKADSTSLTQHATTDRFRFEAGIQGEPNTRALTAIWIYDRQSGDVVQSLSGFDAEIESDDLAGLIQLVDANFDGHPDLLAPGISGGAGPNYTRNVFLYDPQRQQFVRDQTLSELTQLHIDARRREIHSASRGSCCQHSADTYRYYHGKLQLVESRDELWDGKRHITTTWKRSGRGWIRHTRKEPVR